MEFLEKIEKYSGKKYYELAGIIKKELDKKENSILLFEYLAFQLSVNYNDKSIWGTHYGPFAIFKKEDGTVIESPSINFITKNTIEYWEKRFKKTENLFLKFRYGDLIIDLKEKIIGEKVDYNFQIKLINIGIEGIEKRIFSDLDGKYISKRLLDLIISINKLDEYKTFFDKIIDYENKISVDEKAGLWGFSFDYLINNKKIKLKLTDKQVESIINNLENKFNKFNDIFLIRQVGDRLLSYYNEKGDKNNLLRVLNKIKDVYYSFIKENKDGLLIQNYFQEVINLTLLYQNIKEVYDIKNQIINDFQNRMKESKINYQTFETSIEIPKNKMKEYVDYFFNSNNNEEIIGKIALGFVENIENVRKQLDELIKKHPLLFVIKRQQFDNNNLPVNEIGGVEEDYDSNLKDQILQNLEFGYIFIEIVLNEFIKNISVNDIINLFRKRKVLLEGDLVILESILKNYYNGNYLEFNSISIPFIEGVFRKINNFSGYTVINYKNNKIEYKSLNYLLTNGLIRNIYGEKGEDFEMYFKIILTDSLGYNLRNLFAHGIELNNFYSKKIANRIFHIILCLSLIKS